MLKYLLPLIPQHELYCEPFIGGGAKFWAKQPSNVEIINDKNGFITNFYKVIKTNFTALSDKIKVTLHSRQCYKEALLIYKMPEIHCEIDKAWSMWVLANMSYGSILGAGFGYNKKTKNSCARKVNFKRDLFEHTDFLRKRLENTTIEHSEAHEIISRFDTKDTYFYLDPPYINTDLGHYKGYNSDDFERDLNCLSEIHGKFLLSSFDSDILKKYVKNNNWYQIKIERSMSINKSSRKKVEILTANYPIAL